MPIYQYKCSCGFEDMHYTEVASRMKNADEVICEKCGKKMNRQFATPTINMRGMRGITSRTDVEIETKSLSESMREMSEG